MANSKPIKSTLSLTKQARQRLLLAMPGLSLRQIHEEIAATLNELKPLSELTKEEADRVYADIINGRDRGGLTE